MRLKNKFKDEVRDGVRRVGVFLIEVTQLNFGYNTVCIMKELPGQLEILPNTVGCDVDRSILISG